MAGRRDRSAVPPEAASLRLQLPTTTKRCGSRGKQHAPCLRVYRPQGEGPTGGGSSKATGAAAGVRPTPLLCMESLRVEALWQRRAGRRCPAAWTGLLGISEGSA